MKSSRSGKEKTKQESSQNIFFKKKKIQKFRGRPGGIGLSSQIHRKQRQEDQAVVRANLDDFSKILLQRAKYKIGAELQLSGEVLARMPEPLGPAVIITIINMKHRICTLNTTCVENK